MLDSAVPREPPGTDALFGQRWAQVQQYAELLGTEGVVRGVIGPREVPRIWTRHIRNSLAVVPYLAPGAVVIDLGSGAGLPGIPVALARPDLRITLLDAMQRRIAFLQLARDRLGLRLELEHTRAERATSRGDTVICRAVARAPRLLPLAQRLVQGAGELVALKGRTARDEAEEVQRTILGPTPPVWAPDSITVEDVQWPDPAVVFRARWQQAGRPATTSRPERALEQRGRQL